MNLGWLFILMAAIYFLLTVVLRVSWLRGRWNGNQVPVSTKSNVAWSIFVTTWSLPFLLPEVKGHVAPLALLGMILGFCFVFTSACFDAREARQSSKKGIKSSTAPDGTQKD
jgi:membrane protein CcdC involved in cytochrome C biogenesis